MSTAPLEEPTYQSGLAGNERTLASLDERIAGMEDGEEKENLIIYRAMITARQIDKVEQELTQRGEAFFHISGAGHEATAMLAPVPPPKSTQTPSDGTCNC